MSKATTTAATTTISPIDAVMKIMKELAVVMQDELQMVKKQDLAGIQELRRRKSRLILDYQAHMRTFASQPDLLKETSPDILKKLKTAGTDLDNATQENAVALKAAVNGTQRLINNIIRYIKKEALPEKGYTNPNTAHQALGVYSPTCPPVAVNRTA